MKRPIQKKDVFWCAINNDRPLTAFAGIWTIYKGDRGICVAAATGCGWAVFQMLQRASAFGGRFWSSNPVALFAGVTMRHAAIVFVCWIVGVAAFVSLIVLNHGLDELTKLLATIRAGAPKH